MGTNMESLQTELIMDILSRVPTLDLLKLTFVCRRWSNIILNDPLFRQLHHARVMSNPNENLVLLVKRGPELYWVDLKDKASPRQVAISLPRIPDFSDYDFIGSCNGLLCLVSTKCFSILVMNPFTRNHVSIPMPREMKKDRDAWWGFGFDKVTKLFKVVGVFSRGLCISKGAEVSVYDLGSANSIDWRSIVVTNCPLNYSVDTASCFFNGRLHWTYYAGYRSLGIISFDLTDEEFRVIPTPDNPPFLEPNDDYLNVLIVFGGCLCLLQFQTEATGERTPELQIWVMKEYGIRASWVMEVNSYPFIFSSLNLDLYGCKVLGFGKDGELVMSWLNASSEEDIFLSSDSTCNEFKPLQLERRPYYNGLIIHTATLDWI